MKFISRLIYYHRTEIVPKYPVDFKLIKLRSSRIILNP